MTHTLTLGRRLGAYFDLTRMSYFGPPVAALFLLGALLGFGVTDQFHWLTALKVLIGGLVGTSAGFVLNDVVDRRHDLAIYGAVTPDKLYLRQMKLERPFTRARPLAAGMLSSWEAIALSVVLAGVASAIAWSFPSPRRYFILGMLGYNFAGEPLYCLVKQRQMRYPFATFITASLIGLWPVAGYSAVTFPDRAALLLFLTIFLWETGHNQVYDVMDYENDLRRGLKVMTVLYGLRVVSVWVFVTGVLVCASVLGLWLVAGLSYAFLGVACGGLAFYMAMNLGLLFKPSVKRGAPAEQAALALIVILFLAAIAEMLVRFAIRPRT